mmetsp:Transcript_72969/g.173820  ORF Transcript_72969/g.173820 Transcript_72969/m.173820 type:complete len:222 (+) Transcript_72969:3476-4141(+)
MNKGVGRVEQEGAEEPWHPHLKVCQSKVRRSRSCKRSTKQTQLVSLHCLGSIDIIGREQSPHLKELGEEWPLRDGCESLRADSIASRWTVLAVNNNVESIGTKKLVAVVKRTFLLHGIHGDCDLHRIGKNYDDKLAASAAKPFETFLDAKQVCIIVIGHLDANATDPSRLSCRVRFIEGSLQETFSIGLPLAIKEGHRRDAERVHPRPHSCALDTVRRARA